MEINNQTEYNQAIEEYTILNKREDKESIPVWFRLIELSSAIENYEKTYYKKPKYHIPNHP
jgi:hypothetical protein